MARVALSTAPFSSIQKGDNMKKIKKILPLLLGVMVLMFGTLTVSAATVLPSTSDEYEAIIKKYQPSDCSYAICYEQPSNPSAYFGIYYFSVEPRISSSLGLKFDTPGMWYEVTYNKDYDKWNIGEGRKVNSSSNIGLFMYDSVDVKYSNFDIYRVGANKETDEPFFRGPVPLVALAEVLPEVVRERTKVILTTAVACLALLVILSVLPKKLPRFLNR